MTKDRFDVQTGARRTALRLPGDEATSLRISGVVHQTRSSLDTPFDRKVDFWFAAVAWAVHHDLEPSTESGEDSFNHVAGEGSQGDHLRLEDWQLTLLNSLYLRDHPDFLDSEEGNLEALRFGRYTDGGSATGSSPVIQHANRYAIAGARPLLAAITPDGELAIAVQVLALNAVLGPHAEGAGLLREVAKDVLKVD